jgi:hypothetical protein
MHDTTATQKKRKATILGACVRSGECTGDASVVRAAECVRRVRAAECAKGAESAVNVRAVEIVCVRSKW